MPLRLYAHCLYYYAQFLSCFMLFLQLSRTSRLNPHLIIIYAVCCILLLKSNLGSVTENSFKWICGRIAMTDVLDISPVFETGQVFIHVCRGLTLHTLARRVQLRLNRELSPSAARASLSFTLTKISDTKTHRSLFLQTTRLILPV